MPFIVLSVFNRFSFGKIVGVVNQSTLFLDNREIPLNKIEKIVYHPRIMSRRRISFSYATFVIRLKNSDAEDFDVVHFPIYGLWKIKKYNKKIKLGCDKYIWFLMLCPAVVSAILTLLMR